MTENKIDNTIVLNTKAKEYVPKKKKNEENIESNSENNNKKNIEFNLNAKEFVPKTNGKTTTQNMDGFQIELEEDEDEDPDDDAVFDELVNQELNDPMPIDEEDESDEDKWFPKYKECVCCQGYIYKCSGDVCGSLGVCFCKAQEDYDPDMDV